MAVGGNSAIDRRGGAARERVSDGHVETASFRRAWRRLNEHPGHHLLVGSSGHGKSHALQLAGDLLTAREGAVVGDLDRSPSEADVLVLDDAHLRPPHEVRNLCSEASERGGRVLLAAAPDPEWRRRLIDDSPSAPPITVTSLEPWDAADVLEVSGNDAALADLTPTAASTLVTDSAGIPWLVMAELRGDSAAATLHRLRDLPDEDHDLLIALACGRTTGQHRGFDHLIAAGLLSFEGTVPLLVRRAVVRHGPQHRVAQHMGATLDGADSSGDESLVGIAEELVGSGLRDARLARIVERSADALLDRDPEGSADRYQSAIGAGGDVHRLSLKSAEARALAGDVAGALTALESIEPSTSTSYLRIATTLSVLGRQPERAGALWQWARGEDIGSLGWVSRATGAYALFGVGDIDGARSVLADARPEPPSAAVSLARRMTEGVSGSLVGDGRASLPALIDAAAAMSGLRNTILFPDHPAALAALLCLGSGDVAMAESVLAQAHSDQTLSKADRSRVNALRAWVAMTSNRFADAERHLQGVDHGIRRDEPWLRAIRIGLARRRDDIPELTRLWAAGRSDLLAHPEDLYALLPLGELGLAGARMHDFGIVDEAWARAIGLLNRVGDPPAWSATFHWYGVQAAILRERPKALAPHASSLMTASRTSPYAARLATAARVWVAALGGHVDTVEVDAAARALGQVGQGWEGARLAAHAAARADSRRDAAQLMECARDLRPDLSATEPVAPAIGQGRGPVAAGGIELTAREREVVELVLAGLTYREIGARLFLSAKTVEHHMARIKRRSDATNRGDLLRQLAATLDQSGD